MDFYRVKIKIWDLRFEIWEGFSVIVLLMDVPLKASLIMC